MHRIPEPELMNDPLHVAAYAGPNLDKIHWLFIQFFRKFFRDLLPDQAILDLGCGTAAIALQLAKLFPQCEIHGVDGASHMLAFAREAIAREGREGQVQLFHAELSDNIALPRERYAIVISSYVLHHLQDPLVLWNAIRRYGSPHAAILIMDLLRPTHEEEATLIVAKYMPDAPPLLRQDMLLSLRAAYTLDEIGAQLELSGLTKNLTVTKVMPFLFVAHGYLNPST